MDFLLHYLSFSFLRSLSSLLSFAFFFLFLFFAFSRNHLFYFIPLFSFHFPFLPLSFVTLSLASSSFLLCFLSLFLYPCLGFWLLVVFFRFSLGPPPFPRYHCLKDVIRDLDLLYVHIYIRNRWM
jgi:hypothetical protein